MSAAAAPPVGTAPAAPTGGPAPRPAAAPARWTRAWWQHVVPRPTPRLAAAVGAVALATLVLVPPVGWLLLGALALAAVVDAVRTPAPHDVELARLLPRVVVLGASDEVAWVVGGASRRLRLWLVDDLRPSVGAARRRVPVDVPAQGRVTARVAVTPWRRGTVRPAWLAVRVAGPWGLVTRQGTRHLPGRLEVHPAFPSRRAVLQRLEQERLRTAGLRPARELGSGTDFDHLREYRQGDDVRRVDWGATVRLGRPVVRTFRTERDRPVLVLVEHGRAAATLVEGVPRLDHLLDAAMGVVTAATRRGDRAGVAAYATDVTAAVAPARRADQVRRVAAVLHTVEPALVEADHLVAFTEVAARQRRRALLVVGTDLGAASALDALRAALPVLTSRHEVVVASVADPHVTTSLDPPDGHADVRAVHHAGAAADVRARRTRAAVELERLGATVVDAPPDALATALVDTYLGLAARGRV